MSTVKRVARVKLRPGPKPRVEGVESTRFVGVRITPEERLRFKALAWFRKRELSDHIRALLETDYAAAEKDGLRDMIAVFEELTGAQPVRKKAKAR